jgi:hypothetical protein
MRSNPPMIEFNDVRRRYWRDQGRNPDAAIPVKGGDFVERDGQTYAVLYDCDGKPVAAYRIAGGRLMRASLDAVAYEPS